MCRGTVQGSVLVMKVVVVMKMEIVMVKMMVTIVMVMMVVVMVIVQEEKLHPDPALHEKWRRYV